METSQKVNYFFLSSVLLLAHLKNFEKSEFECFPHHQSHLWPLLGHPCLAWSALCMSSELLKRHKCSLPACFAEWLRAASIWVFFQLSGGMMTTALLSVLAHIGCMFFPFWGMLETQLCWILWVHSAITDVAVAQSRHFCHRFKPGILAADVGKIATEPTQRT